MEQVRLADMYFNDRQLKVAVVKWKGAVMLQLENTMVPTFMYTDAYQRSNDTRNLQVKQNYFAVWKRNTETILRMDAEKVERFVTNVSHMQ